MALDWLLCAKEGPRDLSDIIPNLHNLTEDLLFFLYFCFVFFFFGFFFFLEDLLLIPFRK